MVSSSKAELLGIICSTYNHSANHAFIYASYFSLSSINYFKRGAVKEVCRFAGRSLTEKYRYVQAIRTSIQDSEAPALIHIYSENPKLLLIAFTTEYPTRIIFSHLRELYSTLLSNSDYVSQFSPTLTNDLNLQIPQLKNWVKQWKFPNFFDPITIAENKIQELQIDIIKSLDKALGTEKELGEMLQLSEDLKADTKLFYKQGKKMNKRCCVIQ